MGSLNSTITKEELSKEEINTLAVQTQVHNFLDKRLNENEAQKLNEIVDRERESDTDWEPPNPSSDSNIWRYIDFTQLMSILEREQLWFSHISEFADPYEGTKPQKNVEDEVEDIMDILDIGWTEAKNIHKSVSTGINYSSIYVNCWNLNPHESAALWEQYIESTEGVAIQCSVNQLEQALEMDKRNFELGSVEYIDYERDRIPSGRLPTVYHKRNSFEHEKEFRISYIEESGENPMENLDGFYVDIDIDELLDKIYLAPTAQEWFYDQIENILDTYNIDCELVKSDIYSDPVY